MREIKNIEQLKRIFHRLLFILFFFSVIELNAQTGIGTTTPNASAKLDVFSNNKGFLPPRVSLTDIYDQTTIASPATGLLVYCKGDAGLAAGYYYWNGNAWSTIATSGGSGSFASSYLRGSRTATQSIAVGGVVTFTNIDNSAGNDISLNTSTGKITLAPGNTYRLRGAVPNFSGGQRPSFIWYNETTSSNIGSATFAYNPGDAAALGAFGAPAELIITPNVSTVISLRLLSSLSSTSVTVGANGDFPTTGSYPWFDIQVISGNAPVTGQSVDYAIASLSANQAFTSIGNVPFNTIQGAGITLTNGGFNLLANKTYKLEAEIGGSSTGYGYYGWADGSNNLLSGGSVGTVMQAGVSHSDAPQGKAVVYYTPTTNTTVYLRIFIISGTVTAYAPSTSSSYSSTWATISQIGSSAIVNPWVLSGNNVYNTTGNVGIGTNTPAATLDVNGTANATTLNLTNATIGTPSLVLKNGDAAASYSDIAQIKMGWSGSAAGKSQYAQFIHSRHNSGATNNAIDFYLSNGTADNTITSGSTKAMSLESPGNLTVAGKINLTDPSGNVAVKSAGFVNAGSYVSLDNINATVPTSGNRGLCIATNSGSIVTYMSGTYGATGGSGGGAYNITITFNTTLSTSVFSWHFGNVGDTAVYSLNDTTNNRFYRITVMIGYGYNNNFISIERLL